MRFARLATIGLFTFTVFSTGCIGCIDDEENDGNGTTNNVTDPTADCQPNDLQGVIDDADFSEDIVLCGAVTLQDNLRTTDDIEVTIRPGTVITVGVDNYIEFGYNNTEVTLIAEGTADDPITFQGLTPEPGHWRGVYIRTNVTSASVFKHVNIRHAAGGDSAALEITNSRDFEFGDVLVENVDGVGVRAEKFGDPATAANLSVNNADGPAVELTSLAGATSFPVGGTFADNTENVIVIDEGDFGGDVVMRNAGIPYSVVDNIRTTGDMEFTIEAGVEIQMGTDRYIELGYNNNEVTVNIVGTADEPIRFYGSDPSAGHWEGLYVRSTVTTNSVFDYIEVSHSGSGDDAGMTITSPVTLTNATFSENAVAGLFIGSEGLAAESENVTVVNDDGPSAIIHFNAASTLPTGGSYGSGTAYVEIDEGDFDTGGTVPALDVPYRVADNIRTTGNLDLTIESGAIFEVAVDKYIEFGYNNNEVTIDIDGVTFRGTDPTPGHWDSILIRGAVTSASSFTNNTIEHAGAGASPAVVVSQPALTFEGNTISDSSDACIDQGSEMIDYASTNTLDCAGGDYAM